MNREERAERDAAIIARYKLRGCAESIARDYKISVSGVYAITQKNNVKRWTARGPAKLREDTAGMKLYPEAYTLVARGATKSYRLAQRWLTRAEFLDAHPHTPLVTQKNIGINKTKVEKAMRELAKIGATLCTVAPFRVTFANALKFIEFTHKQYIVFLAHPYAYLLDHKNDIRSISC